MCFFLSGSYSYVEGVATLYLNNFVEFLVVISDLSQSQLSVSILYLKVILVLSCSYCSNMICHHT